MNINSICIKHQIGTTLTLTLVLGLVIRLIFIPFTSSPFDVGAGWTAIIQELYAGNSLYDAELYKYTPIWGYILSIIAYIANLLNMASFGEMFTTIYPSTELTFGYGFISNPEFNILLKIPALIFDILSGFAFYRLVMDITGDKKKSEIAFALWFLCPVVISSSAILCMFDSMMVYFMIESIIFFRRKNMLLAGIFIMLSILTKAFSAILLPLMIAYILSEHGVSIKIRLKNLTIAIGGGLLIFLLVYIMPITSGEFLDSLWFLTSRADTYSGNGGFSITQLSFNNIFFYLPLIVATITLSCILMCLIKSNRDKIFLILTIVNSSIMFCFPFVSYTPTYGVALLLPIILLYAIDGKIAYIPWFLTIMFTLHGIAHYWETYFYSLAAFTDLLDVPDIVEHMNNENVYNAILYLMSSAGFAIMVIVLWHYVIPFIKEYRSKVVKTNEL